MNKNYFSLTVILLSFYFSFSQSKQLPGYYISKADDSVACSFKFTDWNINPEYIVVTVGGNTLNLGPDDVKRFGIDGYNEYESHEISYHEADYSASYTPDNYSEKIIHKKSFLKIVEEGVYTLYVLVRPERSYYFISENKGTPAELLYRVRRKEMKIEEDNTYRKSLFDLFSKEYISYEYSGKINNSTYTTRDIGSLVKALNAKYGTSSVAKREKVKQNLVQLDLFAGYLINKFPSTFEGHYTSNNSFNTSSTVTGGINFMHFIPGRFRSFAIGVSVGYNQYDVSGSKSDTILEYFSQNYYNHIKYEEKYSFKNKFILIDIFGLFVINPVSKAKIFIKAGMNGNIGISENKDIQFTYHSENSGIRNGSPRPTMIEDRGGSIPIQGMYYNLKVGGGVIAGRSRLEFSYFTPVTLNSNIGFKTNAIGFYYYYALIH